MANKEGWREPTEAIDGKYRIDCMTIAPMKAISKNGTWMESTGAEQDAVTVIASDKLTEGVTIVAENGGREDTEKATENEKHLENN